MTSLTLVRRIKARPSIVFDALTTAEGIASWWGPDGGPVLVAESDPQVGGRFRVRFRTLDGSEHESSGEYLEVVKPERLSMSWRWTGGVEIPASRWSRSGFAPWPRGPNSHSRIRACTTRRVAAATRKAGTAPSTSWNAIFWQPNGAFRDQASATEPSATTAMGSAGAKPLTRLRPTPRESQRSMA